MTRIAVVTGNPKPGSRTHNVALEVARVLAAELPGSNGRPGAEIAPVADLAEYAPRLFDWADAELTALTAEVAAADVAVFASPTYKASYTGMLKAFLDRYGSNGLAGVTAVPVLTIGAPVHALAVEHTLRPLLVELGASVPTRGIAFPAGDTDRRAEIIGAWRHAEASRLAPALSAASV
jgi:FMN reductase